MIYFQVTILSCDLFSLSMQVLTETDHCYCVLLNAHGGAAFPSENANCGASSASEKESQDSSSGDNSSLRVDTNFGKTKNTKVTILINM
jgi:hypothetical protein